MIERCYSDISLQKRPTYKNITVCEEWLNFSNFHEWFNITFPKNNLEENFELDKDLMDNKIYSPESCIWLPKKINSFLNNNKTGKNIILGTSKHKNKFKSTISLFNENKRIFLGVFDTAEESNRAYTNARLEQVEKAKQYLRDLNYLPEEIIQLVK